MSKQLISIVGGIQPKILLKKFKGEHLDNGLAQRFLFAYPEKRVRGWTDATIDEAIIRPVIGIYKALINLRNENEPDHQLVRLSPNALNSFSGFCNELAVETASAEDIVAESLGKLSGYSARIALVLHELKNAKIGPSDSEEPHCITFETMGEAIKIANWFKNESIRVFNFLERAASGDTGGLQHIKRDEIKAWLRSRIKDDPVLSKTLEGEATAKGFTWAYVQYIANIIGIKKTPSPQHDGKYIWKW